MFYVAVEIVSLWQWLRLTKGDDWSSVGEVENGGKFLKPTSTFLRGGGNTISHCFGSLYMDGNPPVLSCSLLYWSVDWFECWDKLKTCPSRSCLLNLVSMIWFTRQLNNLTSDGGQSDTATVRQGHTWLWNVVHVPLCIMFHHSQHDNKFVILVKHI